MPKKTKMLTLPPPKEKDIQTAICEYLTLRGIFHWRANTGGSAYPGKNGKMRYVKYGFKGVADIIGIRHYYQAATKKDFGQFIAIEVKRPGGKPSLDQVALQQAVEAHGGIYILARSVDDVQKGLGL